MNVVDLRTEQAGICGVTTVGGTGIEWVCIKPVHGKVYARRSSDRTHRKGDLKFSPGADKHYMVRKWPNRKKK